MDLDSLLARFRGPLIGYFAGQGHDPRTAIELAQDVFAEAFLSYQRFDGDSTDLDAVGAWLRGIAMNLQRAERRRRSRRSRLRALDGVEVADARDDDPEASAVRTEERERLLKAIDRLRGSWRTVLYMHYIEGSGLREIGALLGLTERAVEGRLRRARHELRSALAENAGARS